MNINKALKTEYYSTLYQLIKHEHIRIYLFINCLWIDIWISSLLNWYLSKFSCCHLHHKTPSNSKHLESSPVFAIPTSPLSLRNITHETVSDCNSSAEKRSRDCCGACSLKTVNHRRRLCKWGTWVKSQKRLRRVVISHIRQFMGKK